MNLTAKILFALAQHDGLTAQSAAITNRGLRHTSTTVRHLIVCFEDWYAEASPLEAEIRNEGLTGDFVDEFTKLLKAMEANLPGFERICKAMDEFAAGKGKPIEDIFEGVDE